MFKQRYILEVKGKEAKTYRFECAPNSPLGEIHDALFAMKSVVLQQMAQDQKEEPLEEKVEDPDVE